MDDFLDLAFVELLDELAEGIVLSRVWNVVEKFQMRTPTTTSTIQKSRLLSVEFKPSLLTA